MIKPISLQLLSYISQSKDTQVTVPYKHEPVSDVFVKSVLPPIDIVRIKNLNISHFRLVDSNSVRGVTLAKQPTRILKELKNSGINTIVDLRQETSETSQYAQDCINNGLNYFNFKLKLNMPIFNNQFSTHMSSKEVAQFNMQFKDNLVKFFEIMNKGRYYISCLLGLHRTDLAMCMNYLLNPREPESPPLLSHMYIDGETNFTNKYIGAIKNLYKNLSAEDRAKMGMPENFREIFDARISKLRLMNAIK